MNQKNTTISRNSITYSEELKWLVSIVNTRLEKHFSNELFVIDSIEAPIYAKNDSVYADWVLKHKLNTFERLIVISSLSCIFSSHVFDKFLIKNKGLDKRFTEFGGKIDDKNSRFIPTLETIAFLCYGDEIEARFNVQSIFNEDHIFNKNGFINYSNKIENDSSLSRVITLSDELIQLLTLGVVFKPDFSNDFPAKLIKTGMEWEELVLSPVIHDEIENINAWMAHKDEITDNIQLNKKFNKGYKCLFYGPPGTGKTLSSVLIGKRNNKDVYRVDLSQVVSKYVGETEKNLAKIFNMAENKDWILFFDEAESLFSKRTSVSDSKDKFANQQTAYLLQRVEEYTGLIILATNLKPNIDGAFSRRIQTIVNFTIPESRERKVLWTNSLFGISDIKKTSIEKFAKEYKMSGGDIKNVIQYAWLLSKRNQSSITEKEIIQGIRRELIKDGKSLDSIL